MTLVELQAWILRTIKRPEKTDEVVDAINAAIEIASSRGDYAFDLVEGAEAISATEYAQTIVISTLFPRFRKIKYLRPTGYTRTLTWKDPSRVFTPEGRETVDCWYRAGANIVFKLSVLQSQLKYGYYAYPARLTTGTNSYTDMMSTALHDLSCGRLFQDMGNDAEGNRLTLRGMQYLAVHKADKQDGVAHS